MDDITRKRFDKGQHKCEHCGQWTSDYLVGEDEHEHLYYFCRPCCSVEGGPLCVKRTVVIRV